MHPFATIHLVSGVWIRIRASPLQNTQVRMLSSYLAGLWTDPVFTECGPGPFRSFGSCRPIVALLRVLMMFKGLCSWGCHLKTHLYVQLITITSFTMSSNFNCDAHGWITVSEKHNWVYRANRNMSVYGRGLSFSHFIYHGCNNSQSFINSLCHLLIKHPSKYLSISR